MAKHPTTHRALWVGGLAVAAAAVVGAGLYFSSQSAGSSSLASNQPITPTTPSKSSGGTGDINQNPTNTSISGQSTQTSTSSSNTNSAADLNQSNG